MIKKTKKTGRPLKIINEKQFLALCAIQCTQAEICAVIDVDEETLNSWCKREYKKPFSEVFSLKRMGGAASLRRNQWKNANENMNATMQIWLGKQYLNQKDKFESESTESKNITINFTDV